MKNKRVIRQGIEKAITQVLAKFGLKDPSNKVLKLVKSLAKKVSKSNAKQAKKKEAVKAKTVPARKVSKKAAKKKA